MLACLTCGIYKPFKKQNHASPMLEPSNHAAPARLHSGDSCKVFHSYSWQSLAQDCKLMLKDDIVTIRSEPKWLPPDDLWWRVEPLSVNNI